MSGKDAEKKRKEKRGTGSDIFHQKKGIRWASEDETFKAVQKVMRQQAGVIRLLEKE